MDKKPFERCLSKRKDGRQCRRTVSAARWAAGHRDCGGHKSLKQVNEKYDKLKAELDEIKGQLDAKNREESGRRRGVEGARSADKDAGKKAESVDANLSQERDERAKRGKEAQRKKADTAKQKAYPKKGKTFARLRKWRGDRASSKNRKPIRKKRVKRFLVGTGRSVRRTQKWLWKTAKENIPFIVKQTSAAVAAGVILKLLFGG